LASAFERKRRGAVTDVIRYEARVLEKLSSTTSRAARKPLRSHASSAAAASLTRVAEGLIRRDDRFGYIALPDGLTLAQAISTYTYDPSEAKQVIAIATERRFEVDTGLDVSVTPL
jgi:hypothetical protein